MCGARTLKKNRPCSRITVLNLGPGPGPGLLWERRELWSAVPGLRPCRAQEELASGMALTAARLVSSGQLAVVPSCMTLDAQSSTCQAPVQSLFSSSKRSGEPLSFRLFEGGHGHGIQGNRIKVHRRLAQTTTSVMGVRGSDAVSWQSLNISSCDRM